MTKVELARQLGVSKAYVTMLVNGERQPCKRLQRRIVKLTKQGSLPDTFFRNGVPVVASVKPRS